MIPKRLKNDPQRLQNDPKSPQNEPKRRPRGPKKPTRTARRKKDRTKTIPRPSWTAQVPICPLSMRSAEPIWEAKTAPKPIPKRSKIEAKNQEVKKPIQDDLGPVLGRSWVVLGALLGPWKRSKHYACRCFVKIHVFEKKRCQEVTWTDLVSILEAKRVQNGRRGGSESEMR